MKATKLKKRYRITSKLMDILEIVKEAKDVQGNFMWHMVDGKRLTYSIQITDFKLEDDKVFLAIENKTRLLEKNQTVYLRFPARDAAFKTKVHETNDFELVLVFPSEILACERRKNKRYPFHLSDEKKVQVRLDRESDPDFNSKPHHLRALDISENGASLFIPNELKSIYRVDACIAIEALGDHKLAKPNSGTIVSQKPYVIKSRALNEDGFWIGIRMNSDFPEAPFAKFLIRPSLYTIEEKRLIADSVFRDKVHNAMDNTLQKIKKNKSSKTLFQKIDFDRADPDYVKIHIRLLCEVLCGVGVKVGWVSEKSLDKLIYVAYMHDVYLLDKPELARIQSRKELERMSDQLTLEEKEMVLDSPRYAAELARLDQESYPDTVKILLQQREFPDGSGFPYGVTGSQLTPLSCLFIFSHYFVDYMIDNPNWTLDTFLKAYQRQLKGAYFLKIFQALA